MSHGSCPSPKQNLNSFYISEGFPTYLHETKLPELEFELFTSDNIMVFAQLNFLFTLTNNTRLQVIHTLANYKLFYLSYTTPKYTFTLHPELLYTSTAYNPNPPPLYLFSPLC